MLNIIGFIVIFIGFFGIFSGIIGLIRFPDFFTKAHASGVIECAMIPLILIGLSLLQSNLINVFKLFFIIFLMLVLNPVSSHMLAKAKWDLDYKG